MGTPANKQLVAAAGLLRSAADEAGPDDVVIAVRANSSAATERTLARADAFFTESRRALETAVRTLPRTLDAALRQAPAANLALISVPGQWAASEARSALRRGLHVMLFSAHVPVEDEIPLKPEAARTAYVLMG